MSLLPSTNNLDKSHDIIPNAHDTTNNLSASVSTTLGPISNTLAQLVINSTSSIPVAQHILANDSSSLLNNNSGTIMAQDTSAPWFEMPKVENFIDLFSICCSIAVIFGGLVPYIPQYLKIKKSMNSDGFSTYVCLTLLIANILRIMFWVGHRFELPLLIQSFVIIAGMLAMMEICIRVKNKDSPYTISAIGISGNQRRRNVNGKMNETNDNNSLHDSESMPIYSVLPSPASTSTSHESFTSCSYHNQLQPQTDIRIVEATEAPAAPTTVATSTSTSSDSVSFESHTTMNGVSSSQQCQTSLLQRSLSGRTIKCSSNSCDFWDWDDYYSYVKFLSLFTLIMSLLTYLLKNNSLYVESLGFVAVFTESMLGMPQLLRNYAKKSTAGMSVEMVVMWLSGDLFKTLYFILRHAPAQFYVCGSIQVVVDILILGQVLWYKRPNVTYRKLPKST